MRTLKTVDTFVLKVLDEKTSITGIFHPGLGLLATFYDMNFAMRVMIDIERSNAAFDADVDAWGEDK